MARWIALLLAVASVHGFHPPARAVRATIVLGESGGITPEGIEAFRERQRLRSVGAPLSEWSVGADPADSYTNPEEDKTGDGYTAPTGSQAAAADALFETLLRDELPDGFADGLDDYV